MAMLKEYIEAKSFYFYYNLILVSKRNQLLLGQAKGRIGQVLGYLI